MKNKDYAGCKKVYESILAIDVDSITPVSNERMYLETLANHVRPFLRSLGLTNRMVSVTVPSYSMAMMVHVSLPRYSEYLDAGLTEYDWQSFEKLDDEEQNTYVARISELHTLRFHAEQHLGRILRKAFPQCDSRTDIQTDYFDDPFFVGA